MQKQKSSTLNRVNLEDLFGTIREKERGVIFTVDEKLCDLRSQLAEVTLQWKTQLEEANGEIQYQLTKINDCSSKLRDHKTEAIKFLERQRQIEADHQTHLTQTNELLHNVKNFQDAIKLNNENVTQKKEEITKKQQAGEQKKMAYTKILTLYSTFLGLCFKRTDNDLWFTFKYINNEEPDDVYAFKLSVVDNKFEVIACEPMVPTLDQLVAKLNETNDLSEFLIKIRKEFCFLAKST